MAQCFLRFGVPVKLHSDQGREFGWQVFWECCELLGIQRTNS